MRIEVITVELFDCELSKAWDFSKRFFGKPFKAHAPIAIKPLGGHLFTEHPKAAVSLVFGNFLNQCFDCLVLTFDRLQEGAVAINQKASEALAWIIEMALLEQLKER